jgi:hypothetical protein
LKNTKENLKPVHQRFFLVEHENILVVEGQDNKIKKSVIELIFGDNQ